MENEENKKMCCTGKEKCEHGTTCCGNWRKCNIMKWVIVIVALIIVFYLGSQWGEMKSDWRGNRFDRGSMMNWNKNKLDNNYDRIPQDQTVGEITVDVNKIPADLVQ